jgi:hypothetical protein
MLAHDANFFDANNSLAATTDENKLKTLASISPDWQITGGSLSTTDVFEERYVPDYFSLHLTPSNTTDAVLVYLNNIAVPSVGRKIVAGFHGMFYCESDISVTMRIGEQSLQIPDGRTTVIEQNTWTNARSNLLEISSNPSFSAVKFQALITGHQGNPIYFTMPVFYDTDGFKQNNFVQNGRNYIPTYYWDIDGQQENPSYPFYRVFDILTSEANQTALSYIDFFEHEEDDRLPSDTDSTFTKSTLVNPYFVSNDNREWLAQFTGARLHSNVDSVARTYDSYERTTDTVTDDQLWGFMVEDGGFDTLQELIDASQITAIEQDILEDWKDPVYPGGLGKIVTPSTHSPNDVFNGGVPMHYLTSIDFNYIGTDYTTANTSYATRTINIDLYDPVLKKYTNFGGELTLDQRRSASDRNNAPSVQLDLWWDESKTTELENLSGEVTVITAQPIANHPGQKKYLKMVGQKIDYTGSRHTAGQNRYSPDGDLEAEDINLNVFGSASSIYDSTGVDIDAAGHKFVFGVFDSLSLYAGYVKLATTNGKRIHPGDNTPEFTVQPSDVGLTSIGRQPRISYDGTTLLVQDDMSSGDVAVCSIDWDNQSVSRIGDVVDTGINNTSPCISRDGTAFFVTGPMTNAAKIYDWDGTSWNSRTMPDTSEADVHVGGSMSADGNTIILVYKTDSTDMTTQKVRSFRWNGVSWTEIFGLSSTDVHNDDDATASAWNHNYGSHSAIDQTGTVCVVSAIGWFPEGHSTQNYLGAVYVYDLIDNGAGELIWSLRAELTGKDDFQPGDLLASTVNSMVGNYVDLSDNGKVVVAGYSQREGSSRAGTVVWYWNSKTNSYNRSVAMDNDSDGSFRDSPKVAKAASPIVDDEWFDVIKNHNLRFSGTTYQTGIRALAVNWGASSGTNLDAFEATLNSLARGDYIYIEDADNKIYRMRYAGGWSKPLYATSTNYEQYPAKYNDSAGHQVHLIPYEGRLEIVSGTGDGTPTATSFQGSPASRGTEWDGEIGQTLNFVTASTITNFFTTAQEIGFINWQIQNSYYGHKSGSRESMIEAVRQVLTGDKVVAVSPNYSGLTHRIHLRTIAAETSNVDSVTSESLAVLNAAAPTIPTGFYFTHETVDKLFFTLNNIGIGRLDVSVLG